MIDGANCIECGRCNGGDVCRNAGYYGKEVEPVIPPVGVCSWLIPDSGFVDKKNV